VENSPSTETTPLTEAHKLAEEKQQLILKEKIKKNLLWVSIFSIIMLFAGITSGYIVASGSAFWVKVKLPNQFTISTIFILLSSLTIYGATYFVKNNKAKIAKPLIGITLLIAIAFGYFQYQGFLTMNEQGNAVRAGIINVDGKYGEYYTLSYNQKEITFDGQNYFWQGKELDEQLKAKMIVFCSEVMNVAREKEQPLSSYGIFILKYNNEPVIYLNNRFEMNNYSLSPEQKQRLYRFTESIVNNRGDFYMVGSYGVDFTINYKGQPVAYKNRKFYQNGQELSAYQLNQLNTSQNQTGSFIFAFVFVHGLHWIAGVIMLLVLLINTLKDKYTIKDYIGLKIGSIYWHFLGILWLYLYAFLNLIH
jgi:cytochrome c oxidase subunit 3